MPVLSVVNGKGGVGKSTLTSNIVGYLHLLKEKETLIIDLDFQSSSMDWVATARALSHPSCDAISLATNQIDKSLVVKNTQLQIDRLRKKYEYVCIDCRGTIDEFIIGALRSSDIIITPLNASALDLQATSTLLDIFNQINASKGFTMQLYLVLNNVTANTNTLKDAVKAIKDRISNEEYISLCKSILYRREDYKTAWANGISIFSTDNDKAKAETLSFIEEIFNDI